MADGPVAMLNLLKFKPDGAELYREYSLRVLPMIFKLGGQVLFAGLPTGVLIGDPERDGWDECVIVQYPSMAAFTTMVQSAEWKEVGKLRERALVRSVLAPMAVLKVPSKL